MKVDYIEIRPGIFVNPDHITSASLASIQYYEDDPSSCVYVWKLYLKTGVCLPSKAFPTPKHARAWLRENIWGEGKDY